MRLPVRAPALALVACLAARGAVCAGLDVERCAARPSPPERTTCLSPLLATPETEGPAITALEKLLDDDPQGVERVAAGRSGSGSPPLRARLLALQGRALLKLGRNDDAVKALAQAIE